MTSEQRRERQRIETREKILAAARELFLREGFEAVSMRKIAHAIEYTPAAIYTHFADKTQLMMALGESDFRLLREAMRGLDELADPVERLLAGGRAYVRFAFDHPHHYKLMFMTKWPHIEPAASGIEHGDPDEDAFACLVMCVEECIRGGHFKECYSDVQQVAQAAWAAVHGVVSLYLTHGDDPWVDFQDPKRTAEVLLLSHTEGLLRRPHAAITAATTAFALEKGT